MLSGGLKLLDRKELDQKKKRNPQLSEEESHVDFFSKDRVQELIDVCWKTFYGLHNMTLKVNHVYFQADFIPRNKHEMSKWDRFARVEFVTNRSGYQLTFLASYCICGKITLLTVYDEIIAMRFRYGSVHNHKNCGPQECYICKSSFPKGWEYKRLDAEKRSASFGGKDKYNPSSFLMCWGCNKVTCENCMDYRSSGYCNSCIEEHDLYLWIQKLEIDGILEDNARIGAIVGMTLEDIKGGEVEPLNFRMLRDEN